MSEYSVTIKTDVAIADGHGFMHTWIEVNRPGKNPEVISFSPVSAWGAIQDVDGKFDEKDNFKNRPNHSVNIPLTEKQADAILREHEKYKHAPPSYDMSPDGNGDYNCVTYGDKVLQAGGVDYLKGIQTPYGVASKMWGFSPNLSAIESLFDSKDALDSPLKKSQQDTPQLKNFARYMSNLLILRCLNFEISVA